MVSLEVAAAVGSQQKGDQLSLAGVGSRSPRSRGVSGAPFWVGPSPFAGQPRVRFLHQRELAGSCLLTYLTPCGEVDGMLGPGEPKDGKGVSTVKGHLYPCPTRPLCQHSSHIFSALLVPLTKLSLTIYGFFHFIAEIFSLQTHPYIPHFVACLISQTLVGTFRFGQPHTSVLFILTS